MSKFGKILNNSGKTSTHRAENIFPKYLLYNVHEIARKDPREKKRDSSFSDSVYCSYLTEHFINNVLSCCLSWRWWAQAASHSIFSCDKIAGPKSRLLVGDSAFGGKQLRQGGCDGARTLRWDHWLRCRHGKRGFWMELDSKSCYFYYVLVLFGLLVLIVCTSF
jgi:hypothetical protein